MLTDSAIPGSAGIGQTLNTAKYAYQQALSKIGLNRQNMLRQYGYQGDWDQNTGQMTNMRIDGGNQFGGLQTLLRSHAQDAQGAVDNATGRNIHGGLAHQMQSGLDWQHGQQDAQFGQQVANDMYGLTSDWRNANDTYNNALYEAELAGTRGAVDTGNFSPGDYSGIDIPAYGDGSPYAPSINYAGTGGGGSGNLPSTRTTAAASVMKKVAPQAAAALAARSAGMNAKYGLGPAVVKNAYTNPKTKKRG